YSLTKQIEQVQSDTKLSGDEKVAKLKTLEENLKEYDEKVNAKTKETDASTNTEAK
ncbi:TPA: type VII secretion protein EssB, partial [Listeria innocua]|nr:type VII secretion protein EssB [Listeria innocua]